MNWFLEGPWPILVTGLVLEATTSGLEANYCCRQEPAHKAGFLLGLHEYGCRQ